MYTRRRIRRACDVVFALLSSSLLRQSCDFVVGVSSKRERDDPRCSWILTAVSPSCPSDGDCQRSGTCCGDINCCCGIDLEDRRLYNTGTCSGFLRRCLDEQHRYRQWRRRSSWVVVFDSTSNSYGWRLTTWSASGIGRGSGSCFLVLLWIA